MYILAVYIYCTLVYCVYFFSVIKIILKTRLHHHLSVQVLYRLCTYVSNSGGGGGGGGVTSFVCMHRDWLRTGLQ